MPPDMTIQPRHQVRGNFAAQFEEEFPKAEGPPPIHAYDGAATLEATDPEYTVHLDAGAFRAVWELLESEAKYRYPTRATLASARAYNRGVESFRRAFKARGREFEEAVERVNDVGTKTISRRNGKQAPPAEPAKSLRPLRPR